MSYAGERGEANAIHRPPEAVESIEFKSGTIGRLTAPGSMTDGRFGLFRWDMPARAGGADPHFHRTISESFFVLSGRVTLFDGSAWLEAPEGHFLFVPEGGIHGFRNDGEEPASMLILFAPGAPRERYFEELAEIGWSGRTMTDDERAAFLARHDQYSA
jgi:mannose-6-phosphate isomerase-like protein (cupin superfamily)